MGIVTSEVYPFTLSRIIISLITKSVLVVITFYMQSCLLFLEGKNGNLNPKIYHLLRICLHILLISCLIYKISTSSNMQLRVEILSI